MALLAFDVGVGVAIGRTDTGPALWAQPGRNRSCEAPAIRIDIVGDREGFDALEADWNDLVARAGTGAHVFQTFAWNWHWCNHYLTHLRLAVVAVRRHGRLVMLWPLVVRRAAGLTMLEWMGAPVSQYGDVLCEPSADQDWLFHQVWQAITERIAPDIVSLRKVRADAVIAPFLSRAGFAAVATEEAPYLDLASANDFADYEQRYSSKQRRNRRRLRRRLGELGPVCTITKTSGPGARSAALTSVGLKRAWLKSKGLVSRAFADERVDEFFAAAADGGCRPAGCAVSLLTCGGLAAGAVITVSAGRRRALHISAYDTKLEKFGPGVVHMEDAIRQAFQDGMATFDLLAPRHDYKMDWADGVVAVTDFALGLSLRGRLLVQTYFGFLRPHLKTAATTLLPAGPRRMLAAVYRRVMPR